MGIIRKMINKKEKEATLWPVDLLAPDFRYNILTGNIDNLKNHIQQLSWYRRKDEKYDREQLINWILKDLESIDYQYNCFLDKFKAILKVYEDYKNYCPTKLADALLVADIEVKIKSLMERKKALRSEFEKIYLTFKKTVKNLNDKDIPMNRILKQMREVFDFDGKKFNFNKTIITPIDKFTYYDATIMKIKNY